MKKILAAALLLLLLSGCSMRPTAEATPVPTAAVPTPTAMPTPEPTPEPVILGGRSFDVTAEALDLRDADCTAAELSAELARFQALREVDLHGCALTTGEKLTLANAFPEVFFGWEADVLGVTADSADKYICLDGIPMEDTAALEELLPLLPRVTKIDMCDCGIADEDMYQLNLRHEGIRFVWVAALGSAHLRTDATYFNHNDIGMFSHLNDEKLDSNLRYFPDLIALDLGHCSYDIRRCDWLQYTPKLQYLILADCQLTDVSPIGELKDLKYLEVFSNPLITDISALGSLEKLETLNLCITGISDISPLKNCTALRYCWLNYCWDLREESVQDLAAALPDCTISNTPYGPTSGGWRDLDVYFEMRDAFHSEYMGGDHA